MYLYSLPFLLFYRWIRLLRRHKQMPSTHNIITVPIPILSYSPIPIPSMYGISTYISHTNPPNVGKYSIPMDPLGIVLTIWPNGISRPQSLILFNLLCEPRCWGKKMIETWIQFPKWPWWYPNIWWWTRTVPHKGLRESGINLIKFG